MGRLINKTVRIYSKPMKDRIYNFCVWAAIIFLGVWTFCAIMTGFGVNLIS